MRHRFLFSRLNSTRGAQERAILTLQAIVGTVSAADRSINLVLLIPAVENLLLMGVAYLLGFLVHVV